MGTPADVITHSVLYMRIYFVGMPAFMIYNFGAAILRAIGDTKRPLYFLTVAGVVNVVFNLFFVVVFNMGVAGVAVATVISQAISAALILLCLLKMDGMCHCIKIKINLHGDKVKEILRIGILRDCRASFSASQRSDSVVGQFLRLHRHGRQYRRKATSKASSTPR